MARRYPRVFGSAAGKAQSRAAFSASGGFFPVIDAALGGVIESNLVTLTNVGSAVPLTISGGSYSKNGGAYSTTATTVSDGDTLRVRVTAPSTNSATATATVSVNSIARSFSVTTAAPSTGTPTLTLSATSPSIASNAAAGTLVSNISNVPAGATPTVTPNDGRLVIAGDASAGWKVVVGMSALSAGTINFSVAATGATGASGVLTVTAVAPGFGTAPLTIAVAGSSTPERFIIDGSGFPLTYNSVARKSTDGVNFSGIGSIGWGVHYLTERLIVDQGVTSINYLDCGVGGTTLAGDWLPAASARRANLVAVINAYKAGGGAVDVVYLQVGSNDASSSIVVSQAAHMADLRAFMALVRNETNQPNLRFILGGSQGRSGGSESNHGWVREAEMLVGDGDENVRFGMHTFDKTQQSDETHMDGPGWLDAMNEMAVALGAWIRNESRVLRPKITTVANVSNTQTDVTLLHNRGNDFTPTTALSNFVLSFDNGTSYVAPTAAVRLNATTIRLTHANTLGNNGRLKFAALVRPDIVNTARDNATQTFPLDPVATPIAFTSLPYVGTQQNAFVDFTPAGATTTPANYNNFPAGGALGTGITLLSSTGTATGLTMNKFSGAESGTFVDNPVSGNTTVFADAALTSGWSKTSSTGVFEFLGADPNATYEIEVTCSRVVTNRPTRFAVNGGTFQTVDPNGNVSVTAKFQNVKSDANGRITVSYVTGSGSTGYINALRIGKFA